GGAAFVAKYSPAGALLWAKKLDAGGAGEAAATGLAYDPASGDVVVTGYFGGTATFEAGPSVTSAGLRDAFVLRLSGAGAAQWLQRYGDTDTDEGQGVAVGAGGGVYVTGDFSGTVDFDPLAATAGDTLVSAGSSDAFVVQLNNTGGFVRAGRLGSAGTDAGLAAVRWGGGPRAGGGAGGGGWAAVGARGAVG